LNEILWGSSAQLNYLNEKHDIYIYRRGDVKKIVKLLSLKTEEKNYEHPL
jgi:hypothetical protein